MLNIKECLFHYSKTFEQLFMLDTTQLLIHIKSPSMSEKKMVIGAKLIIHLFSYVL